MYDVINEFYHKQMTKDCDYDKWCEYLCGLLDGKKNAIELGCGTGLMTYRLASRGKKLIGVDISEQMLTVAESRLKSTPDAPFFVRADMVGFVYPKNKDFVISVCDGFNYISPQSIPKVFKKVFSSLKKGGIFTFDISSEYKLRNVLADNVFYIEDEKNVCLWTNKQSEGSVEMNLTLFSEQEDGRYIRSGERHVQFIHSESFILDELSRAGFKETAVADFMSDKRENARSDRLQFRGVKL